MSAMSYGCGTWTMTQKYKYGLQAMDTWMCRKIIKTKMMEQQSNESVLEEIQ